MKIGIISDTHDNLHSLAYAFHLFEEQSIEALIHCGDWIAPFSFEATSVYAEKQGIPVYGVLGNNVGDLAFLFKKKLPSLSHPITLERDVLEVSLGEKTIAVYHGHDPIVLDNLIHSQKYHLVCTGHTHESTIATEHETLIVNPGTTCFARSTQLLASASVGVIDTVAMQPTILTYRWEDI